MLKRFQPNLNNAAKVAALEAIKQDHNSTVRIDSDLQVLTADYEIYLHNNNGALVRHAVIQ